MTNRPNRDEGGTIYQGQMICLKATGARFEVEEVEEGPNGESGQRAILRGVRTGGRLMAYEVDGDARTGGLWARRVEDNGRSGDLFGTLTPTGGWLRAVAMF